MPERLTRRNFLELGSKTAVFTALTLAESRAAQSINSSPPAAKFSSSKLGVDVDPRNIEYLEMDLGETLDRIYSLPVEHSRIPIAWDRVAPKKGRWSWKEADQIIEKSLQTQNIKSLTLQFGFKTIGWPEVNVPDWLKELFPQINQDGAVIGKQQGLWDYAGEYLAHAFERYLRVEGVKYIHLENEAFSRRLDVTRFRSIDPDFYLKELKLLDIYLRQYGLKDKVKIAQNFPTDTPEMFEFVIRHSDSLGINVYNQHNTLGIPDFIYRPLFWTKTKGSFAIALASGKEVKVPEFQVGPWNNEPFHVSEMENGAGRIKQIHPQTELDFWNPELAVKSGDKKQWAALNNLAA